MDRVEQLRQFIASRRDEPFPRYALALELKSTGDQAGAAAEMQELLRRVPHYLAASLQLRMLLQTLGNIEEVSDAYRPGQDLSPRTCHSHTLSALNTSLE